MVKKINKLSCPQVFILFIIICMVIVCIKETISHTFYFLLKKTPYFSVKNSIDEPSNNLFDGTIELNHRNIQIIIDSTNEQLKYENKINSNHMFINPNFNIEDFEVEKIDLDDFNI